MDDFIKQLRNSTPAPFKSNMVDYQAAKDKQAKIEARSGGNIKMPYNTGISDKYKNILMDAVKFYQGEFKVTPKANIYNDPTRMYPDSGGSTSILPRDGGRHDMNFRWLTAADEAEAERAVRDTTSRGWAQKNMDLSHVPTHELGHALFATLFPIFDTSSNADQSAFPGSSFKGSAEEYIEKTLSNQSEKLLSDALRDMGSKGKWQDEAKKISLYATTAPYEAVAESLSDYYINRDKATPLSKAVVKRLKSKGSMYGINQTGGVDTIQSSNFYDHLRRYSPLK